MDPLIDAIRESRTNGIDNSDYGEEDDEEEDDGEDDDVASDLDLDGKNCRRAGLRRQRRPSLRTPEPAPAGPSAHSPDLPTAPSAQSPHSRQPEIQELHNSVATAETSVPNGGYLEYGEDEDEDEEDEIEDEEFDPEQMLRPKETATTKVKRRKCESSIDRKTQKKLKNATFFKSIVWLDKLNVRVPSYIRHNTEQSSLNLSQFPDYNNLNDVKELGLNSNCMYNVLIRPTPGLLKHISSEQYDGTSSAGCGANGNGQVDLLSEISDIYSRLFFKDDVTASPRLKSKIDKSKNGNDFIVYHRQTVKSPDFAVCEPFFAQRIYPPVSSPFLHSGDVETPDLLKTTTNVITRNSATYVIGMYCRSDIVRLYPSLFESKNGNGIYYTLYKRLGQCDVDSLNTHLTFTFNIDFNDRMPSNAHHSFGFSGMEMYTPNFAQQLIYPNKIDMAKVYLQRPIPLDQYPPDSNEYRMSIECVLRLMVDNILNLNNTSRDVLNEMEVLHCVDYKMANRNTNRIFYYLNDQKLVCCVNMMSDIGFEKINERYTSKAVHFYSVKRLCDAADEVNVMNEFMYKLDSSFSTNYDRTNPWESKEFVHQVSEAALFGTVHTQEMLQISSTRNSPIPDWRTRQEMYRNFNLPDDRFYKYVRRTPHDRAADSILKKQHCSSRSGKDNVSDMAKANEICFGNGVSLYIDDIMSSGMCCNSGRKKVCNRFASDVNQLKSSSKYGKRRMKRRQHLLLDDQTARIEIGGGGTGVSTNHHFDVNLDPLYQQRQRRSSNDTDDFGDQNVIVKCVESGDAVYTMIIHEDGGIESTLMPNLKKVQSLLEINDCLIKVFTLVQTEDNIFHEIVSNCLIFKNLKRSSFNHMMISKRVERALREPAISTQVCVQNTQSSPQPQQDHHNNVPSVPSSVTQLIPLPAETSPIAFLPHDTPLPEPVQPIPPPIQVPLINNILEPIHHDIDPDFQTSFGDPNHIDYHPNFQQPINYKDQHDDDDEFAQIEDYDFLKLMLPKY